MGLILEVISGPDAPCSFDLSQTGELSGIGEKQKEWIVGRHNSADARLATDLAVSRKHCAVRYDNYTWRVQDLGSTYGTGLNGKRINKEAELRDGDHIQIGASVLRIHLRSSNRPESHFEGDGIALGDYIISPASKATVVMDSALERSGFTESDVTMGPLTGAQSESLRVLRQQHGSLFAILDAARDARILNLLHNADERFESLYEGKSAERLATVAPYLVELPRQTLLLQELICEGWGNAWGVYLTSTESFSIVRKHLRKFLTVEIEGQENPVLFRFYDPRVLIAFLDASTPEERNEFLGPLTNLIVELSEDMNQNGLFRTFGASF